MRDILGQESEQGKQPTSPRAGLKFMLDFSLLVPTGNRRAATEDTRSSFTRDWRKERRLLMLSSNSLLAGDAEPKWGS